MMSIGMLVRLGEWLRELSLSGSNAAAWAIVLALTALPALGLLWRGRRRADWLLLLAAGVCFTLAAAELWGRPAALLAAGACLAAGALLVARSRRGGGGGCC